MENSNETYEVLGVDANLPTYLLLMVLFYLTFVSTSNNNLQDEAKINRPRMHFLKTALKFVCNILFGILCATVITIAIGNNAIFSETLIFLSLFYYAIICFNQRKNILKWFIRLYQFRAPAELRSKCQMVPSCSQYMILAVDKFGVINGVNKGVSRLRRCSEPSQIDYP